MSIRDHGNPGRGVSRRVRVTSVAFAVATASLVTIGLLSYRGSASFLDAARWSRHTQEVTAQVRAVEGRLADAETAGRGFALTANDRFLADFEQARFDLPGMLAALRALTADNAQQQRRVE